MDKFRALEFFIATIDGGSFAAAAQQYATDPSTVSKAIKRLEEQLGLQLFQRSTRKLSLTSAGKDYADTVRQLADQLKLSEESLKTQNETPSGSLKLNLPVSYGRHYVQPMLNAFRTRYPDIDLDVTFSDKYVDMIGLGVDVSIRSGNLSDSRLVAQKLTPMEFVVCAAPAYCDKYGVIPENEYSEHPWIRFRFKQTGKIMPILLSQPSQSSEPASGKPGRQLIVDDGDAMADFASAGLGLCQLPHFVAKTWVEKGLLQVISQPYQVKEAGVYIIYPKREYLPLRTRLFVDFVKDWLAEIGESSKRTWASC